MACGVRPNPTLFLKHRQKELDKLHSSQPHGNQSQRTIIYRSSISIFPLVWLLSDLIFVDNCSNEKKSVITVLHPQIQGFFVIPIQT